MKYFKLFCGALALTMFGACSDSDQIVEKYEPINPVTGEVAGYLAVEIKLPQDVPTRAEDEGAKNDQFGDGTAAEYKVHNALVALFKGEKGKTEDEAKFFRVQNLEKPFFDNLPTDDPVSASYIAAIEVKQKPGSNDVLYALVVLNRNDDSTTITIDEDDKVILKLGGTKIVENETTFGAIKNIITENSFLGNGTEQKFFMINAPMSTKKAGEVPGEGDITYLTKLGSTIYDTPEEAKEKVSGCVYVERAVAKVTCKELSSDALKLTIMGEDGNEVDLTKNGWSVSAEVKYGLANTPKESYLVRNVDFTTTGNHFKWDFTAVTSRPRMLGNVPIPALSNPFHNDQKDLYRIYWCKDPHYNRAMTADDKNPFTAADLKSRSEILYCKENTFQVQFMNYNSTTLAIFEVDFTIKKGTENYNDLFIRDGNNAKIYLSETSAYADGITRITRDLRVQQAIQDALKDKENGEGKEALPKDFSVKDHLEISFSHPTNDKGVKYLKIDNVELKCDPATETYFHTDAKAKFTASLASHLQTLLDGVNALTDVTVYEGAKCYYTVPVKHFGDYYTPWDKENIKGTTTKEVYNENLDSWDNETHAKKYLGRYGMVRNNWYELNISKITALGDAKIPDTNVTTSDDNNEDKKYFALEIHILSWAKRLQDIPL